MQRGLLLDRDGVVNVDHGYVGRRERFEFLPGLFPFLRAAEDLGFHLAILTNQEGVARGKYGEADFHTLTAWMLGELRREGIAVDLVLACFEHNQGTVAPYVRESFWRKPNPGMVLETVQRLRLDPTQSFFLGDKPSDMEAAKAGGIRHRLLLDSSAHPTEDYIVVRSFDEAFDQLRKA